MKGTSGVCSDGAPKWILLPAGTVDVVAMRSRRVIAKTSRVAN